MDTYADGNGPIDYAPYQQAIQSIESGGNYGALGPVTAKGDRAYGAYQVMGANVPDWTAKHYGQSLTPDEFLKNKEAQDAVFKGEFGSALQKHGNPQDAASVWFSGRPLAQAGNASDGYNTTHQYVSKFNKALGGTGALSLADTDDADDPVSKLQDSGMLAANNVVGPGALTPQRLMTAPKEDDRLQKVAQGVTGIGAALAGISSPQQAYALNQQLQTMKKDNESKYKTMVTKDGRILRIDQDGNIDSVGGNPAASAGIPALGDQTKSGADYLATLDPTDQQLINSWHEGTGVMPSSISARSNPRIQSLIAASMKAYPDMDFTRGKERQIMATDLAKSAPSSAGGQVAAANASLKHLDNIVEKYITLKNGSGAGSNLAARAQNAIKNAASDPTRAGVLGGLDTDAGLASGEITKVITNGNGGVHERAERATQLGNRNYSPEEAAGVLDAHASDMKEKYVQTVDRIKSTMGQSYIDKHPEIERNFHSKYDALQSKIEKLRKLNSEPDVATTTPDAGKRPPLDTFKFMPSGR